MKVIVLLLTIGIFFIPNLSSQNEQQMIEIPLPEVNGSYFNVAPDDNKLIIYYNLDEQSWKIKAEFEITEDSKYGDRGAYTVKQIMYWGKNYNWFGFKIQFVKERVGGYIKADDGSELFIPIMISDTTLFNLNLDITRKDIFKVDYAISEKTKNRIIKTLITDKPARYDIYISYYDYYKLKFRTSSYLFE